MNYAESERALNRMQDKNHVLFRMAISHLLDVGARHLTEYNVESCCKEIDREDDTHHFMSNAYKKEIVRTAAELAKIDPAHLLVYIQRNMTYDVGDGVNVPPLIGGVKNVLDDMFCGYETAFILRTLRSAMLSDEEIAYLGYGWCIPEDETEDT